jgi:hypothetical protein
MRIFHGRVGYWMCAFWKTSAPEAGLSYVIEFGGR